jgi:gluconolactonase
MKFIFYSILFFAMAGCKNTSKTAPPAVPQVPGVYPTTGTFERYDPAMDAIVAKDTKAEIIASGFDWSEGSLWVEKINGLLFSDVPTNTVYKWTEQKGKEVYLKPSGYTGTIPSISSEPGSNGLLLDNNGNLVLCQHGDRRMAKMDAALENPMAKFVTIADKYQNKKFSSPNDAAYNTAGELYFTDPPYGLPKQNTDPTKETPWNGIYKVKADGTVLLLVDSITRPNGIAFFPGFNKVLVACSDAAKPNWYIWDIKNDSLVNGKVFFSAAGYNISWKGLPDGLKIDKSGNVFATGPGGIYFFNSTGKKLGMLRLDNATSNCALSPDEKTLYVTNDMYILRIKMRS